MKYVLFLSMSLLLMFIGVACEGTESAARDAADTEVGSNDAGNIDEEREPLTLTSPLLVEGGALPDSLKCERDGGTGESPPIEWTAPPEGTESFAIVMEHYPQGTAPGTDAPSQYWLVWNIPGDTRSLAQGNPEGIGTLGSDKDRVTAGYTPPCSPPGSLHSYTIRLYALSERPSELGSVDDVNVDWTALTTAIGSTTLASASLTFTN